MQDNTFNTSESSAKDDHNATPVYTVTMPALMFGPKKHPNPQSQLIINRLTTEAMSIGATFLDCKFMGESAIIQTDNLDFAKKLNDALKLSLKYFLNQTIGLSGQALIPGQPNSKIIDEATRDFSSLTVTNNKNKVQ
jgi:hypothetical protein